MKHNNHEQAAAHYTQAALHQTEAHKNHQEGNDEKAAHHAQIANGHDAQADDLSRDAAKKYSEKQDKKK